MPAQNNPADYAIMAGCGAETEGEGRIPISTVVQHVTAPDSVRTH